MHKAPLFSDGRDYTERDQQVQPGVRLVTLKPISNLYWIERHFPREIGE